MRIAVLGIGRMGGPIVARLRTAGFDVLEYDPVTRPGSLDGVIEPAEILITILPGAPEVETLFETLSLPDGILWLDLTSNDPRVAQRIAATGLETVGAPMGGGVAAAESGSLHFFVGGAATSIDRVRPILEVLGRIEHVGPDVGDGYTAKLLANLLWFGQAVAVTEALLLGQSLGLAPSALRHTLAASAGGSVFISEYLDRLLDGDYLTGFGIDRCVEELETIASLARQQGVPFELSTLVARQHRDALERFGAVGGELLAAKLLEERAGRTLRR